MRIITRTRATNVKAKSTVTTSNSWCFKANTTITGVSLVTNVENHLPVARNSKWCWVVGIVVLVNSGMLAVIFFVCFLWLGTTCMIFSIYIYITTRCGQAGPQTPTKCCSRKYKFSTKSLRNYFVHGLSITRRFRHNYHD